MCASQLGVRTIFAAGEKALAQEAEALVPGIETVWVKRGTRAGRGDECTEDQYRARNQSAVHMHPTKARARIREGARRAVERARTDGSFGLIPLKPPYRRVFVQRPFETQPQRLYQIREHPDNVCALMALPNDDLKPVESEDHLRTLLVD
jgi:D-aminopeptidase